MADSIAEAFTAAQQATPTTEATTTEDTTTEPVTTEPVTDEANTTEVEDDKVEDDKRLQQLKRESQRLRRERNEARTALETATDTAREELREEIREELENERKEADSLRSWRIDKAEVHMYRDAARLGADPALVLNHVAAREVLASLDPNAADYGATLAAAVGKIANDYPATRGRLVPTRTGAGISGGSGDTRQDADLTAALSEVYGT